MNTLAHYTGNPHVAHSGEYTWVLALAVVLLLGVVAVISHNNKD